MGTTVINKVSADAANHGTYIANMINTLVITPPLTITEAEIHEAVDAIDAALGVSDAAVDS